MRRRAPAVPGRDSLRARDLFRVRAAQIPTPRALSSLVGPRGVGGGEATMVADVGPGARAREPGPTSAQGGVTGSVAGRAHNARAVVGRSGACARALGPQRPRRLIYSHAFGIEASASRPPSDSPILSPLPLRARTSAGAVVARARPPRAYGVPLDVRPPARRRSQARTRTLRERRWTRARGPSGHLF